MRKLSFFTVLIAAALVASSLRAADGPPSIGQPAPQFTLKDLSGHDVSLKDFAGKIVVLEWTNPDCPFVQRHYNAKTMTTLSDKYKAKDVVWLAITTGNTANTERAQKFVQQYSVSYPILLDPEGATASAYQAKNTPHLFIINKDGTLAYRGGIDDNPDGKNSNPTNYVDKALSELTAGQSVSLAETKPYGCSIKYK